ncbi:unnamed protein product [Paramecium octaurelia]|uniref:DNA topoisomerase n=1 Tax=Paramecium octaurelia TaxID=43137 RepID=A0A8S1VJD1_PAROT|nr:unnamed protein product [Paramecium octaurelia]
MNNFKTSTKSDKIKVLNVAEKPSVARSIANVLSKDHRIEETKSPFNKLFKLDYRLKDVEVEMWITSVTGHLKSLKYPQKYQSWEKWDPIIILKEAEIENNISTDKQNLELNLKNFASICNRLILWLDCDREGENIAFEVMEVCREANPNIQVNRAHFSAVTYVDVRRALDTLKYPDENLSNSVIARQEIDLRIGASFTRFQTLLLQKQFNLSSIVSYGPCQIPTLGFVVQRQKEIDSFVKEQFWFIQSEDDQKCIYNWDRTHLFDELIVALLFERCYQESATVINVQQKDVQKWKPYPLCTIEFEKLASKKLKISAHKAMELAERLYNKGYISYPRTETNKFPPTINLQTIIRDQQNHPVWGEYATNLINFAFEYPKAGNKDDKAHPPIHPVKMMIESEAQNRQEWDVYQLIARHFLACCSKNAKGSETTITLQINDETFSKTGLVIKEKNYLEIYIYDEWSQSQVPNYQQGDSIKIKLTLQKGSTSPPKPMTEAELIGLMDKNGIGTDATIHEHINTIQDREYATKRGQIIKPTKIGLALVESYEILGFTLHQPFLRAVMEQRMNEVALGKKEKSQIVQATINEMTIILKQLQEKQNLIIKTFGSYLEALKNYDEDNDNDDNNQPRIPLDEAEETTQNQPKVNKKTKNQRNKKSDEQPKNSITPPSICQFCNSLCVTNKQLNGKLIQICPKLCQIQEDINQNSHHQSTQNKDNCFQCNLCQNFMKIRYSKIKKTNFLGCSSYPQCNQAIFLPDTVKSIKLIDKKCTKCESPLFSLQFNENYNQVHQTSFFCLFPGCQYIIKTDWKQNKDSNQTSFVGKQQNKGENTGKYPFNPHQQNRNFYNKDKSNNQQKFPYYKN